MPVDSYINKNFFDTQRNKYRTVSTIEGNEQWVEMQTEDGKILVIYFDLDEQKEYQNRLEWLLTIREKLELDEMLAFPTAILSGLKRSEVGYVAEVDCVNCLINYIHPGDGEKLFKWYNEKTGGISYRLKIAYSIVNALLDIHKNGLCLVDISPKHTHLQEFNLEKPEEPSVQFTGIERISSYTYAPITLGADKYCDPMIYTRRSSVSSLSDAYSVAVMLFELLTTCHPFVGEDTERLSDEELVQAIDSGKLDCIGDKQSGNNKNEDFEDMSIFLPQDLSVLFEKMFIDGKFNLSMRPTLEDFKIAIIQSQSKIVSCDHKGCGREYPFNEEHICPFCGYQTQKVLVAHIKKKISASEELLPPYDGIKGFSRLPQFEKDVNFLVIKEGTNHIIRKNFESYSPVDNDRNGIWVHHNRDKEKITIRNKFKKLSIFVNGKELTPYTKADKGQHSDASFDDKEQVTIELPNNAQMSPERIIEIESEEYGSIEQQWVVTIR